VRWGPMEEGDIGDAQRSAGSLRQARPQGVVHLAGYIEVGESVQLPERYLYNNAVKTDFLIAAAVRAGVEAFVFSSSCAVYGLPQSEFLAETHQIAPISPYAESKARVERALTGAAKWGCARRRCATSTPPAPTKAARSARRTNPRRTCFH
jgi:UDP-glucose 4-epimerase